MTFGALPLRKITLAAIIALAPAAASAEVVSLRVASARAFPNQSGGGRLTIALTQTSAEKLGAFTSARVGLTIEVRVAGKPVSSPRIVEPILGGALEISEVGTLEEAVAMADALSQSKATLAVRDKD